MTNQDYEQKKRACWIEYCKEEGIDKKVHIGIIDTFNTIFDRAYALGMDAKDAEGEEMLTCEKSDVQGLYQEALELIDRGERNNYLNDKLVGIGQKDVLYALFGSKCLPDETDNDCNIPQPIRQPFCQVKDVVVGDGVGTATSTDPIEKEAKENAKTFAFDRIVKDGFSKERRLNIAAMIMASIMQNAKLGDKYSHIATTALAAADTLIAECEQTDNLNRNLPEL